MLKPSSLGDIVHTLPAVSRLKSAWPEAKISWLVNPEWAPLLAGNPDVAELVLFPRQDFRGTGLAKLYPWIRAQLLGRHPDLALDFQGLLRSALIGRLSGPRRFIGLADAREGATFLYGRTVPLPASRPHAVDRYLALADGAIDPISEPGPLGNPAVGRPSRLPGTAPSTATGTVALQPEILVPGSPRFPLPAGEPVAVSSAGLEPDFILLHPFARGAEKSLTREQILMFCERLGPRRVVLVGRANRDAFQLPSGVVGLVNRTSLLQLIWLLRRAAFVISVDSGPMHLAAALGRPLVAIHTWTDPRRVGPYRPDAWIWKSGLLLRAADFTANGNVPSAQATTAPLSASDIDAICALATSPSCSCA